MKNKTHKMRGVRKMGCNPGGVEAEINFKFQNYLSYNANCVLLGTP